MSLGSFGRSLSFITSSLNKLSIIYQSNSLSFSDNLLDIVWKTTPGWSFLSLKILNEIIEALVSLDIRDLDILILASRW